MEIDEIIQSALVGLFRNDVFNEKLYLKGGQALRVKENLKSRFSADMDFSTPEKISDEDLFFKNIEESLSSEFSTRGFHLFDFTKIRKPKIKKEGTPDFWSGWEANFKLIDAKKIDFPIEQKRREALVPKNTTSSKIKLDISEYEYCGSVEKIKVGSVQVNVYSRVSLVLEKMRAICQQHPDYVLRAEGDRSRDYYDIERLWTKVLKDGNRDAFLGDCRTHIKGVFGSKGVELGLLKKIFEPSFLELQKTGWKGVVSTVSEKVQDFDYYVETLRNLVQEIGLDQ